MFLYSPLRRAVAVVNGTAVNAVAAYTRNGMDGLSEPEKSVIEELKSRGVLGDPVPLPPVFPKDYVYCPHEVTLFPTSRCNLRCRYCYADAGRKSVDMPFHIARAAIDFAAANAGFLGSGKFVVGFHGGGEPTLAWPLIEESVAHSLQVAADTGMAVEFFAATNGVLNQRQREFIVKHFTSVNVSLDGPEDIQNMTRPKANGGGSYAEVAETLRFFDENKFHYGVRSTITSSTVGRMEEIVECLAGAFTLDYLHMEPVWACGRCWTSGERPPANGAFIRNYIAAMLKGKELGVTVNYSGARLDVLASKFCGAPGDNFSVLPDGSVTSCYQVTDGDDPGADTFMYGHYDETRGQFFIDMGKILALQELSVEHLAFCGDCFCKWHCAGDCLARVFSASGQPVHAGSERCELNRALTRDGLETILRENAETGAGNVQ